MARFKVIKGGTLLVAISVVILLAVVAFIAISYYTGRNEATNVSTGAEAVAAFALEGPALALDPAAEPTENEHTDEVAQIQSEVIREPSVVPNGLRVLIYHTHTHEAYEPEFPGQYEESENWRTTDNEHNIVRVGAELAKLLEERGFAVVHDTTDNEQGELSTAYVRSLETLSAYSGENFDLYIDLHRDAYVEGQEQTSVFDGKEAAKLMVLIGNGQNFSVKPHYSENLAFAKALTEAVNDISPGLCRDVLVKTNRYNQHIGIYSILVEVGNNRNTLSEALAGMPALADAITAVMAEEPEKLITVSKEN